MIKKNFCTAALLLGIQSLFGAEGEKNDHKTRQPWDKAQFVLMEIESSVSSNPCNIFYLNKMIGVNYADFNKSQLISEPETVTKKYLTTDSRTTAKNYAKNYTESVLSKKYIITNIGNPESNNYDVEYKIEDDGGTAKMIVNFDFREQDFTLSLKSMTFTIKKTGDLMQISNKIQTEAIAAYYDTTKKLLITLQAEYISPDLD